VPGKETTVRDAAADSWGIFSQLGTVTIDASSSVTDNEPDNCVGTRACYP
jgi:hypothetical protein